VEAEREMNNEHVNHPKKEGAAMNVVDRIILSSIELGIWAWVLITFLSGSHTDC
jgi:hypothetical protein